MVRPRIDNQGAQPPPALPLLIGPLDREAIRAVRLLATRRPLNETELRRSADTPAGRARFRARLAKQRVQLPGGFAVIFTVAILAQGNRVCRQVTVKHGTGRIMPTPADVWQIAAAFGFQGGLDCCDVSPVRMGSGGAGISAAQPLVMGAGAA